MKFSRNREIQKYLISINERIVETVKIQSVRLVRMVAALSLRRDVMTTLIHKKMITMRL